MIYPIFRTYFRFALPAFYREIEVVGDCIHLQPVRRRGRRVVMVDGWPVIERGDGPMLTDADVQRLRDADQR